MSGKFDSLKIHLCFLLLSSQNNLSPQVTYLYLARAPTFWSAEQRAGASCRVLLAVEGLQQLHLYAHTNFKLKRTATLAE